MTQLVERDGVVTAFDYEPNVAQVTGITRDPDGTPSTGDERVTQFQHDANGNVTETVDALGASTTRELDVRNRLVRETGPDPDAGGPGLAHETAFVYDLVGNVLSESVRLDATTDLVMSYTHDALNRALTVTDPNGDTVARTYDDAGRLASFTDAELNTTAFLYDNLDRLIEEINELSDSRLYVHDAVGNVIEETDRNGRVREFDFDALNRLVEERWLDGTAAVVRTTAWSFDSAGNVSGVEDQDGTATTISTYAFTHDDLDRTLTVSNSGTPGAPVVVLTAGYDAVGNRVSLAATVDGVADFVNAYDFDALDRMTRIEQTDGSSGSGDPIGEKRVDLAYNALGQFSTITRYEDLSGPAGTELVVTSTYTRDGADRLTGLEHEQGATSLAAWTWQFDAADRIIGQTSTADGTAALGYDATGQLLSADYTGGSLTDEAFGWDSAGNPTGASFTVTANNLLISDGTYSYEYDAEGNRTRRTTISTGDYVDYTWDHRNRLTDVVFKTSAGATTKHVRYTFDVSNRLIRRDLDADGDAVFEWAEVFVYDGTDRVLVYDDSPGGSGGSLTHRFLPDAATDAVFADENALGEILWDLTDHLGTVRDRADYDLATDTTSVVNHLTYDSFGAVLSQSNPSAEPLHAFTGMYRDPDTDLQLHGDRWYDPAARRWTSEDPIGFGGGDANLYRYVSNSPANLTDPTGLTAWSPRSTVGAVVSAAFAIPGGGPAGAMLSMMAGTVAGRQAAAGFRAANFVSSMMPSWAQSWMQAGSTVGRSEQFDTSSRQGPGGAPPVVFYMAVNAMKAMETVDAAVDSAFASAGSHVRDELREAGNDVRELTEVVANAGELIYSGGPDPDSPYLAAQGSFVAQLLRSAGNLVASGVDFPTTAQNVVRDVVTSVEYGERFGWQIDAARQVGILDLVESSHGVSIWDDRPLTASEQWDRTSSGFGRFGSTLAAGTGLTRLGLDGGPVARPLGPGFLDDYRAPGSLEPFGPTIGRSGFRTSQEFADAVYLRYQRYTDDAYASTISRIDSGRLSPPAGVRLETFVGQQVDSIARLRMRAWLRREGIEEGVDGMIQVNRRLVDSSGIGTYRVPDIRIRSSSQILDGTIGTKTPADPQIRDFWRFSGGERITIVRPSVVGGSYSLRGR